jgi:sugar/nucleoside kinase (ribokinase family)
VPDRKIWDVVVVGDLFIDEVLADFNTLPKLGEEAFARKFRREIGGGAAITACGLAKLGWRVAVLGVVGKEDGIWVVRRFMDAGVETAFLENHPDEATGLTISVSTREDRAFFSYYGANERLPALLREPNAKKLMAAAGHVHFACAPDRQQHAGLLEWLRKRHCHVSLDVSGHESWLMDGRNIEILHEAHMFFPNHREGELMTGETDPHRILRALHDRGVTGVGLKLGGKGAALLWRNKEFRCDPYPVVNVDTTGAGDCFDAGFIHGLLTEAPPQECLEIANICGAFSTRALGGIAGFPSLSELKAALVRAPV